MKKQTQTVSSNGAQPASVEKDNKGPLKLGLDVHYRQVTVAMQEEDGAIKAVGRMNHDGFWNWVHRKAKEGWAISSCYEAGASGYWLHRELAALGVNNLVVAPKAMGRDKGQKTDRRDSAELLECLDRYLRGNKNVLRVVTVPSQEQEQDRALVRYHRQLMADRNRYEGRGKGLLCAQGIELRAKWWSVEGWKELKTHGRLRGWMQYQLKAWRKKILELDGQQLKERKQIEAMAPQELPKGLGAYSAVALECEMKGIGHFKSARAVSSYTGLCPGIHASDSKAKEGSINRCGNAAVRWNLVETVWRMLKWQPDYEPVRELARAMVRSKRAKKRLVVKAARHLAVDLWRLETGRASAQELGLLLHKTTAKPIPRRQSLATKPSAD